MTELEAIAQAKESLKNVNGGNWSFSIMNESDSEDFIWSYLYDNDLQYLSPIKYNNGVVLCHQEC